MLLSPWPLWVAVHSQHSMHHLGLLLPRWLQLLSRPLHPLKFCRLKTRYQKLTVLVTAGPTAAIGFSQFGAECRPNPFWQSPLIVCRALWHCWATNFLMVRKVTTSRSKFAWLLLLRSAPRPTPRWQSTSELVSSQATLWQPTPTLTTLLARDLTTHHIQLSLRRRPAPTTLITRLKWILWLFQAQIWMEAHQWRVFLPTTTLTAESLY